jgi:spermidine synthase
MKKVASKSITPVKKVRFISDKLLLFIAFLEGAVVLSVELLSSKMLSSFFGNSLIVWTSVIGVTITFLTLGYYMGGILSQRKEQVKILSYALVLASVLMVLMLLLAPPLFESLLDTSIYTGSVISTCLLIGPVMFVLGSTSPLIIQQLTRQANDSGKTAGLVYAISTLGGITFTLLVGFLIIPYAGISIPLVLLSLALFIFAFLLYYNKIQIALIVIYAICLLKFAQSMKTEDNPYVSVPYLSEGLLGQLKVFDAVEIETKNPVRQLLVNGIPQTRIYNNNLAMSTWGYVHRVSMTASIKRNSQNVLLFGFGGGSIATELNHLKMKVDAVEIDSRMLDVAKDYFYFNDSTTSFTVDDARHYIRTSGKKKYDLIVFDVLNGEVQPSYVFTTESFKELKNLLNPDGMILIEFQEISAGKDISVYQSICNTLMASGYNVWYNNNDTSGGIPDIIISASLGNIDFSAMKKENFTPCCSAKSWADDFAKHPSVKCEKPFPTGLTFTDDKPMIDILNANTVKVWREYSRKSFAQFELQLNQKLFK